MRATYQRAFGSLSRPPAAARAALAGLAVLAVVLGGVYVLIQLHELSAGLSRLTTQLSALQAMNQKLDTLPALDKTLIAMSGKLSTTNDLLRQANAKLDASGAGLGRMERATGTMAADMHGMRQALGAMRADIRAMEQTLGGMGPDIHAMTQKITHAKLLF